MRKGYYSNGKRGWEGGVPVWRPAWWDELGNDAEYKEATKPRTAFKAKYYQGGTRLTIDGIPTRFAAYVKTWAPWMKRALYRGTGDHKEQALIEQQFAVLFPNYITRAREGMASCVSCRETYRAMGPHSHAGDCWRCTRKSWADVAQAIEG